MPTKIKDPKRVAAGKKSKRKGGVGERAVVNILKELGFTARRTQQYNGKSRNSESDVVVDEIPELHIEVKNEKIINFGKLKSWLAQASADAIGKDYIVCYYNGKGDWRAMFDTFAPSAHIDEYTYVEVFKCNTLNSFVSIPLKEFFIEHYGDRVISKTKELRSESVDVKVSDP